MTAVAVVAAAAVAAAAVAVVVVAVGVVAVVAVREVCCWSLLLPSPYCPLWWCRRRSASGLQHKHRQREVRSAARFESSSSSV